MKKTPSPRSVVIPGFKFSGIAAGIKKTGKDLALVFSENPATIAGVFTTNSIKAAPVKLDMRRVRSHKGRAIIINSGNANACTGPQGLKDANEMARLTAESLKVPEGRVYVASTGLIGSTLPMNKIRKAIPKAAAKLSERSISDTASAIMTTDTFPKMVSKKININGKAGTVAGIAKGAGMISPDMATMLSFLFTDIAVTPEALDTALRKAVDGSFNRLTIDDDMSTNDTVMIMANATLKNTPLTRRSPAYRKFEKALAEIADNLCRMIALDAEGATKLINVLVKGASNAADAEKTARSIAGSLLVKTAVYGQQANWGRIMAAIGYSGARVSEQKISIMINNVRLVRGGKGVKTAPRNLLSPDEVKIVVDMGIGKRSASVLTSDLTEKYIKINAGYMT